jgi:glycosyltransferase involved in cell wall biosynthesis
MPSTQQNNTISIALCLCNPRKAFLEKQLESISKQTVLPNEIVVGDDSDNDMGLKILEGWSSKTKFPCRAIQNKECLGITQNFSNVLSQTTGDYIFLCDQDDVWLPNKIEESIQQIKENERGGSTPVLFHTDLELIDDIGSVTSPSFMARQRIRGGVHNQLGLLMLHNNVTGCSASMNRSLLNAALPIPDHAIVHDWWLAIAAGITGKTVFSKNPLTQYRMHCSNAIGMRPIISLENVKRLLQPVHIGREFAMVALQNLAIKDHFENQLPKDTLHFINTLHIGGLPLLRAASRARIEPQAWSRKIRFKLAAISKTYLRFLPNGV